MYTFTVPLLTRGLTVLADYTDRAAAFTADPAALLAMRLAPDMLSLAGQIQRASDKAKNGVGRLVRVPAPGHQDVETMFGELKDRVGRSIEFIEGIEPAQFEGAETRMIDFPFGSIGGTMTGIEYATRFLLPDFFFHVATAHAILRQAGMQIGKADYLGGGR